MGMGVRVGLRVSVRIRALAAMRTAIAQQAPQVEPAGARLRGVKRGNQRRGLRDVTHGAHQAGQWRHAGLAGTKAACAQKGCRAAHAERAWAIEPFSTARLILTRSW